MVLTVESHSRSIAKAISYRVLASVCTSVIFYILSGNLTLSLGAGALDSVVKLGIYFLHERIWNHIDYGRPKAPDYEI